MLESDRLIEPVFTGNTGIMMNLMSQGDTGNFKKNHIRLLLFFIVEFWLKYFVYFVFVLLSLVGQ